MPGVRGLRGRPERVGENLDPAALIFGPCAADTPIGRRDDAPASTDYAPAGSFDDVTAALASVGLGDVPAWLRPYAVLSNGERFRADLARIVAEAPARVVVDEFTSVVDRQKSCTGGLAFQKGVAGGPWAKRCCFAITTQLLALQPD